MLLSKILTAEQMSCFGIDESVTTDDVLLAIRGKKPLSDISGEHPEVCYDLICIVAKQNHLDESALYAEYLYTTSNKEDKEFQKKVAGSYLKNLRKEKGMTVQAFADFIGEKKRTYEQWEGGQRKIPKLAFDNIVNKLDNDNKSISTMKILHLPLDILSENTLLQMHNSAFETGYAGDELPVCRYIEETNYTGKAWLVNVTEDSMYKDGDDYSEFLNGCPKDLLASILYAKYHNCSMIYFTEDLCSASDEHRMAEKAILEIMGTL